MGKMFEHEMEKEELKKALLWLINDMKRADWESGFEREFENTLERNVIL